MRFTDTAIRFLTAAACGLRAFRRRMWRRRQGAATVLQLPATRRAMLLGAMSANAIRRKEAA